jgi:high frequency lysogenization protein
MKSVRLQATIAERIEQIAVSGTELEDYQREDLQAHEIAVLYADTISQISPRVVVNGKPQHLKLDRTVDWIRTLLLAGLRSAVLWDQLGGGRFELLFGRKRIMQETRSLLMG